MDYHSDDIISPIEHSGQGFSAKDTRFNMVSSYMGSYWCR